MNEVGKPGNEDKVARKFQKFVRVTRMRPDQTLSPSHSVSEGTKNKEGRRIKERHQHILITMSDCPFDKPGSGFQDFTSQLWVIDNDDFTSGPVSHSCMRTHTHTHTHTHTEEKVY